MREHKNRINGWIPGRVPERPLPVAFGRDVAVGLRDYTIEVLDALLERQAAHLNARAGWVGLCGLTALLALVLGLGAGWPVLWGVALATLGWQAGRTGEALSQMARIDWWVERLEAYEDGHEDSYQEGGHA